MVLKTAKNGTRRALEGNWYRVEGVNVLNTCNKYVNFQVHEKNIAGVVVYLVKDYIDSIEDENETRKTLYTLIEGQTLTKEDIKKAFEGVEEYRKHNKKEVEK